MCVCRNATIRKAIVITAMMYRNFQSAKQKWIATGGTLKIEMSINLSPSQLKKKAFFINEAIAEFAKERAKEVSDDGNHTKLIVLDPTEAELRTLLDQTLVSMYICIYI